MNPLSKLTENDLREMLEVTKKELFSNPEDLNLKNQKQSIEEEIAYVQHFGNSRKRRGYR